MNRKTGISRKRIAAVSIAAGMALFFCIGCGASGDGEDTKEELNNLAKVEIYSAESGELIKTVEEEELLCEYNKHPAFDEFDEENFDGEAWEEEQDEREESVREQKEKYYFISYRYPVAKLNDGEPMENMTITLYEDSDIIKIEISQENVKGISVPQEFLTFYEEITEEDREFYDSLAE